jgi:hypothetical protein
MKDFLLGIGINVGLAVSGFFGSLLLVGQQKKQNLREQIISILGGTMSANYLTPIVIEASRMENESLHYGIAFVIGFGGLKVVEALYCKWFSKNDKEC